jgi:hypothetical protein
VAQGDMSLPRVFITHSSLDRELAEGLVDILRLGTNVSHDRIFCSSIDGYGIEVGADFLRYIKEQLQNTELVVPLITPAYLDSTFCKWELGAAWVRDVDMFPIRVPQVRHDQLQGPLNVQVADLTKSGLTKLAQRVAKRVGSKVESAIWEPKRDALLAKVPEMLHHSRQRWATTEAALHRRAARLADQSKQIHKVFHVLRDASAIKLGDDAHDNLDHFLNVFGYAAEEVATCFTGITGVACRITIKQVIDPGDGVPSVVDLARSPGTPVSRTPEPIGDNTDFKELLVGSSSYFKCNNIAELLERGEYENTHVRRGRLPYNSTIVWPIRKTLGRPPAVKRFKSISNWQDLIAYLCVDSAEADVFTESDVWIGAAMADAMYSVLRPWREYAEQLVTDD